MMMNRTQLLAGAVMVGLVAIAPEGQAATLAPGAFAAPQADGLMIRVATAPYTLSYSSRNLQILLNELGYNVGSPDGILGTKSKAAIRAFQTDAGLPVSGEASLSLFSKLQEAVNKQQGGSTQASSATTGASTATPASSGLVASIQGELRQRGYQVSEIDGVLDSSTGAAIRSYQSAAGMAVTGQPSASLLSSLQAAPRSGVTTKSQVMAIQRGLNARGYDAGPVDGAVGPKVRMAIRSFQSDNGMAVTGEISPTLASRLGVESDSTQSVARSVDIGTGLSGSDVLQLEQSLTALGYDVGRVDGIYDASTRTAIQSYQQKQGLTIDGLATPSVLASVQSELGERSGVATTSLSRAQTIQLQQSLAAQGYYKGAATGVYDAPTQSAVRSYQQAEGLSATGSADPSLLSRLQYGTAATAASPELVKSIEQALSDKGYAIGSVDGQIDPQSQKAIGDFIRQARLNISPTPSESLLLAIRGSEMTAKQGAKQDLINTGVNALTNIFSGSGSSSQ
jgi:peptidoglycan hydrolase-like protein with peptidoglycan-binding domain